MNTSLHCNALVLHIPQSRVEQYPRPLDLVVFNSLVGSNEGAGVEVCRLDGHHVAGSAVSVICRVSRGRVRSSGSDSFHNLAAEEEEEEEEEVM